MAKGFSEDKTEATLETGFMVAIKVNEKTSSCQYYIGEIQAQDERGIRITRFDFAMGEACSYDIYIPWANIDLIHVCTPEHDLDNFINDKVPHFCKQGE